MIQSVILGLGLVVSSAVLAQTPDCVSFPTGQIDIVDGSLTDEKGTVATFDLSLYLKRKDLQMQIADIPTGKSFRLPKSLKAYPVARTPSFERILARGIDADQSNLYVVSSLGQIIETLQVPELANDRGLSDYYQFQLSDDGLFVYLSSSKNILTYNLKTQSWDQVLEIKERELSLGWLNSVSNMANALFYQDRVIFKVPTPLQGSPDGNHFRVLNLKTHEKLFEISTGSYTSRLFAEHFLVFDEPGRLHVWDFVSGDEHFIPMNQETESGSPEFFTGPNNSLGVAFGKIGKILFFDAKGSPQGQFKVPPFNNLQPVGNGESLFLQLADKTGTILFDTRNGTQVVWPQLLGVTLARNRGYFFKNSIYLNLYSTLNESPHLAKIDLGTGCLSVPETKALIENPSFAAGKVPILSLLGLEGQLTEVDRRSVANSYQGLELSLEKAKVFLSLVIATLDGESEKSDLWRWYLEAFRPVLKNMEPIMLDSVIESMAVRMTEKLRYLGKFSEVPTSKIANILIESIKPYFGMKSTGRTDFTFVQNGNEAEPLILGTHPIDDDTTTAMTYGFYLKRFPPLRPRTSGAIPYEYRWQHQGKTWQARGDIHLVSLGNFINQSPSINFKNLRSDGKLVGAMIISSNLYDGFEILARQMINYFQSEGFYFGMPKVKTPEKNGDLWYTLTHLYLFPFSTTTITNGKEWLQQKMESGELDYLVKEAHSGGADEVMWLAKKNILLKGSRRVKGKVEEIYILFPESIDPLLNGKEVPIRDQEFGQWIRQREANQGKELVYVNASCWSSYRAKQELIASRSPLLIEIPTTASSWTFSNKPNNHERLLVDLIRKGKTYPEMRSRLDEIQESPNPYIFPNEESYQANIWSSMNSALDYSLLIEAVFN